MTTTTNKLNFVFFGTPEVSSKTLEILKSHGYLPSLIVTAPDRPVGRHFTITPSPTKVWAMENNIPYTHDLSDLTPSPGSAEALPLKEGDIRPWDLFIVVAYGKILSQEIIDLPKYGTLNIHYSLLPRWRGASPVEAAILHGDTETGVSIQKMVFKLDAGPVIAEERTPIDPNETHTELRNRLIPIGAHLLAMRILPLIRGGAEALRGGGVMERVQDESIATHCGKIKKEDGLVNPFTDNPQTLWNKYRAYYGWPGLYFFETPSASGHSPLAGGEKPKRVKITKARLENNKFIIERVIPEGKKEVSYSDHIKFIS